MPKAGIDYIGVTTPFYCHDGQGNLLLHKRSRHCRDEIGAWDTGSGQLEFRHTLEQNVLKEIKEEYGCKGKIDYQLPPHDIFRTLEGKKTHWVTIPHIVRVDPKKVKNNEPHKIDEIGWFTLDNLPTPLHTGFQYSFKKFKTEIIKYIHK